LTQSVATANLNKTGKKIIISSYFSTSFVSLQTAMVWTSYVNATLSNSQKPGPTLR